MNKPSVSFYFKSLALFLAINLALLVGNLSVVSYIQARQEYRGDCATGTDAQADPEGAFISCNFKEYYGRKMEKTFFILLFMLVISSMFWIPLLLAEAAGWYFLRARYYQDHPVRGVWTYALTVFCGIAALLTLPFSIYARNTPLLVWAIVMLHAAVIGLILLFRLARNSQPLFVK